MDKLGRRRWVIFIFLASIIGIFLLIPKDNEQIFGTPHPPQEFVNLFDTTAFKMSNVSFNYSLSTGNISQFYFFSRTSGFFHWEDSPSYTYNILVAKLYTAPATPLNNIVADSGMTIPQGALYNFVNDKPHIRYHTATSQPADSVFFHYAGSNFKPLLINDSMHYYRFMMQGLSVSYTYSAAPCFYINTEGTSYKQLKCEVLFLKRNNAIYCLCAYAFPDEPLEEGTLKWFIHTGNKQL